MCVYDSLASEAGAYLRGYVPLNCCVPANLCVSFSGRAGVPETHATPRVPFSGTVATQPVVPLSTTVFICPTKVAVNELCGRTEGLTISQVSQLRALCCKYLAAYNAGEKPVALTTLTTFTMEVPENQCPLSCPRGQRATPSGRQSPTLSATVLQRELLSLARLSGRREWCSSPNLMASRVYV